jgi:hypothetical protein
MASTYSDLKLELIGTGEQAGSWGNTTNTNLGTAIEEAIVGSADVAFSSADVTLTLTNTNASQTARHIRLNLTGTSGGARNLILGSGCQIDKPYIINNGLADAVTVKNTTGTGVAVPAGKSMWVFNNGTNVVEVMTHANSLSITSLTLTSPLAVASGGTGVTTSTGSGAVVLATSPTLVTPAIGTPTAGVLSSCTVDGTDAVGYRNIPQNSQSTSYTLVLADAGKHIFHPSSDNTARTYTIPANGSVAYPIGTAITFVNMSAANLTISITSDTLTWSPSGLSGSRTLAANGSATCLKITSTQWLISGSGLS